MRADNMGVILIDAYYRIRDGRIEQVREHPRRRRRWAVKPPDFVS